MTPLSGGEGLQPERTALAWQRTATGALVVLLPLVLVDARLRAWPLVVLGSLSAVVAAALVGRTARRHRALRLHHRRPATATGSPWPPMQAVALVTALAAAEAVGTALTLVLS
jgi:uncharacterized membrane protein YidH (DUF202 family)